MSKPSLTSLMAGAAFMAASGMASATNSSCGQTTTVGTDGIPRTVIIPCPSQSPSPSPVQPITNQATVGNVGSQSSSSVTTGPTVTTSSATTGPSSASVDGSNNNTTNFRTKNSPATAYAFPVHTIGHGCFRAKPGVSFGLQTFAFGVSTALGGGEEYATSTLKTTDANGKEIEVTVNQCASDEITRLVVDKGMQLGAPLPALILAVKTAANSSESVRSALDSMADPKTGPALFELFGRQTPDHVVAPINLFNNMTVDRVGPTVDKTCPTGTKPVLNSKSIPPAIIACVPH